MSLPLGQHPSNEAMLQRFRVTATDTSNQVLSATNLWVLVNAITFTITPSVTSSMWIRTQVGFIDPDTNYRMMHVRPNITPLPSNWATLSQPAYGTDFMLGGASITSWPASQQVVCISHEDGATLTASTAYTVKMEVYTYNVIHTISRDPAFTALLALVFKG